MELNSVEAFKRFHASAAQTSIQYEAAFAVGSAIWFVLAVVGKVAGLSGQSWVSVITPGGIAFLHIGLLMYRRRFPETFWPQVIVGWLDYVLMTLASESVQSIFWDTVVSMARWQWERGPFLSGTQCGGEMIVKVIEGCEWCSGLQATFMLCTMISYMTNFVLHFKQGLFVNAVGIPVYFLLVIGSRVADKGLDLDYAALTIEVICMVPSAVTSMSAKRRSEWLSNLMLDMLAHERKQTFSENQRRFKAEFERESLRNDGPRQPQATASVGRETETAGSLADALAQPAHRRAASTPPGTRAAVRRPAKVVGFFVNAEVVEAEPRSPTAGDCLPMDATIWLEWHRRPSPLGTLSAGQRILCYDSLRDDVQYAEVEIVRRLPEPLDWVTLTLADGTEATMTADHPVRVVATDRHVQARNLQARDLEAGVSAVMVHKVVTGPVLVERVRVSSGERRPGAAPGRVAVSVRHPEQYSVLCGTPLRKDSGLNFHSVAVGSPSIQDTKVGERGPLDEPMEFRRCLSEPGGPVLPRLPLPRMPDARRSDAEPAAWEAGSSRSASSCDTEPSEIILSSGGALGVRAGTQSVHHTSIASFSMSAAALQRTGVGGRAPDAPGVGHPSVGSAAHDAGDCRMCVFFMRKTGGCRYGANCIFCHREDGHRIRRVRGKRIFE